MRALVVFSWCLFYADRAYLKLTPQRRSAPSPRSLASNTIMVSVEVLRIGRHHPEAPVLTWPQSRSPVTSIGGMQTSGYEGSQRARRPALPGLHRLLVGLPTAVSDTVGIEAPTQRVLPDLVPLRKLGRHRQLVLVESIPVVDVPCPAGSFQHLVEQVGPAVDLPPT